jgi:hypothetical protein
MARLRWITPILLAVVLTVPLSATAFGPKGHRVITLAALPLLSPTAEAQVMGLLTLRRITDLQWEALWGDNIRPCCPGTGAWHYVNIPADATTYEATRDCPKGCVISALHQWTRILADTGQAIEFRQAALRWILHLMGDIHQPLHTWDGRTLGGNMVEVTFLGWPANLHEIWDERIIDQVYPQPEDLLAEVQKKITATARQEWETGGPQQWAEESHRIAKTSALVPSGTALDREYLAQAVPVIREQVAKAAVRVAQVLNAAFAGSCSFCNPPGAAEPAPVLCPRP